RDDCFKWSICESTLLLPRPSARAANGHAQLILLGLREFVRDLEPRSFRANEDVLARPNRRLVHKRAHGDVDVGAIAHHGVEKRTADPAARVVALVVAPDEQRLSAL